MSYKKYPQNNGQYGCKNSNSSCECRNKSCKEKPEVIYYECKECKHDEKKCCKYIKETEMLIDEIEAKNDALAIELSEAKESQGLAVAGLDSVKEALMCVGKDLAKIQGDLNKAIAALGLAINQLNHNVVPQQDNAIEAINQAMLNQGVMNELIEDLEESFKCAVDCLKDCSSGSSCPIFMPKESCNCDSCDED